MLISGKLQNYGTGFVYIIVPADLTSYIMMKKGADSSRRTLFLFKEFILWTPLIIQFLKQSIRRSASP